MKVTPGTSDVTVYFKLVDPTAGTPETGLTIANLDLTYVRDRASAVKADLSTPGGFTVDSAHTDNAAIQVDATNCPGLYRVDVPDAAFLAGVSRVQLCVNGAAIDPAYIEVELETLQTGDSYARLGAPAGASVSADIADVEGKVDDLEGRVIGTIAAGTHQPQTGDSYAVVTNATYGLDKLARTGADSDTLETLSDQIDGASTLTQQNVRDAMKLAPTAGAPAAGSVDTHLDDILEDTGTTLPATLATIDDYIDTEVAAIKAKTDLITTGTALTVVSAVSGSTVNATIGASLAATISGLTISADWAKVYLTVKAVADLARADSYSILQVVVTNPAAAATDGVLYVQKAAATTTQRTQGSLTVTQAAGTVAIALDEALTGAMREQWTLNYDLKELTSAGAANVLAAGSWNFTYTPTKSTA